MATAICLDYFYGDKVKMKRFIRMPRALLDEVYSDIPAEVKCLYTLMLDRVSLSMRNAWRDNDGRVYIYFTLKDTERQLKVGNIGILTKRPVSLIIFIKRRLFFENWRLRRKERFDCERKRTRRQYLSRKRNSPTKSRVTGGG